MDKGYKEYCEETAKYASSIRNGDCFILGVVKGFLFPECFSDDTERAEVIRCLLQQYDKERDALRCTHTTTVSNRESTTES